MEKKSFRIDVVRKHPGNLTKKIKAVPFFLNRPPQTLRELIEESVRSCLAAYRARAERGKMPIPLTEEQWNEMREIGKFAFGVHENQNEVEEAHAIENAVSAVSDGLVRVFRDQTELATLDEKIEIAEGDVITFVKLTMLSGRMW